MNYKSGINWDLFLTKVDLVHNDKPIVLKNFFPLIGNLVSYKELSIALSQNQVTWEILGDQGKILSPNSNTSLFQNKDKIQSYINLGYTFVAGLYSLHNNLTRNLASEIENIFNVDCDLQIYGSKSPSSPTFPAHCDNSLNFIFQAEGQCDWEVYSNKSSILVSISNTIENLNSSKLDLMLKTTLNPGDMLYIPPRYYHKAIPNTPRLSVSIPCYLKNTTPPLNKNYYKL